MRLTTKLRLGIAIFLLLMAMPEIISSDVDQSNSNNPSQLNQVSSSTILPNQTTSTEETQTSSTTDSGGSDYTPFTYAEDELSSNIEWNLLSPQNSPSPRTGHKMVYDSLNDVMILFGGLNEDQELDETWAYYPSDNTWTNMNPINHPTARAFHSMVYNPETAEIVLFGGQLNIMNDTATSYDTALGDTWIYNYQNNQWFEVNPTSSPSSRFHHTLAYRTQTHEVILYGGMSGGMTWSDMWTYKNNTWNLLTTLDDEYSRMGMESIYDSRRDQLLFFGGSQFPDDVLISDNSTGFFQFNFSTLTVVTVTSINDPRSRIGHVMYYDSKKDLIVLFGGYTLEIAIGETWVFDMRTNTWSYEPYNGPKGFFFSSMAYDRKRENAILFGGFAVDPKYEDHMGQTWKLVIEPVQSDLELNLGELKPWVVGMATISLLGISSYLLYSKFEIDIGNQITSFQNPEQLSEPTKDVISRIFGEHSDKFYVIGANFVSKRNVDPDLDRIIPNQLYDHKFLMHPMRLAMCRILIEHTRLPTAQLREMMGISWSDLSTHTKAMKDKQLIFVEETFVGDKAQQVISIEPEGIHQYETLTKMLIELIDESLLSQTYLDDALNINGDVSDN